MPKIRKVWAEEILNSRGEPTLKVFVKAGESVGAFAVPSGASKGAREAAEKRDGGKRFGGLGVEKAIELITKEISPLLVGQEAENQGKIDQALIKLDGTSDKSRLGGNTLIGVSVALAKAAALESGKPLYKYLIEKFKFKSKINPPHLFLNLVNGGKHSLSPLAFQEYLIVVKEKYIQESLEAAEVIFKEARKIIGKKFGQASANAGGDEGGFVLNTADVEIPLLILKEAIKKTGFEGRVKLSLDAAADSFYGKFGYKIGSKKMSAGGLLKFYKELAKKYELFSIEDPFNENEDLKYFSDLNKDLIVVGDDLTVTNEKFIKRAAPSIGAVIIKPNQIGTLTETVLACKTAQKLGLKLIVSHRSGETDDDFIADLAVAVGAFGIKAGAPNRGERMAKYDRLLEIFNK